MGSGQSKQQKSEKSDSEKAYECNQSGNAKYSSKDYKGAIADYTEAIKLNPEAVYYDNRGDAEYSLGNYSGAEKDYIEAIKRDGENASYYNNRGYAEYKSGKYNEAKKDYTEAIKRDGENTSYYNNRGNAEYSSGNYSGAEKNYTEAIKRDKGKAVYYNNRGNAKYKSGKYNEAKKDYTEAIKRDGENAGYYNKRGNVKYMLSDYNEAKKDYTEAIKRDGENAGYYNMRGNVKYMLSDYNEAKKDYNKAIERDGKNAVYYNHCGNAKYSSGDYDGAEKDYTKAINLDSKEAVYYNNRGNAKYRLGNYCAAKYRLNNYNGAIADHVEAINLNNNQRAVDDLVLVINAVIFTKETDLLINFRYRENNQTLLHFACAKGYRNIVELLLRAVKDNAIYILATDSQNQTALMLAVANGHKDLMQLLIAPLVEARMKTKFLTISNTALLGEINRAQQLELEEAQQQSNNKNNKISQNNITINTTQQLTPAEIMRDYLENGLSDDNFLQVQKVFADEQFAATMESYKEKIDQSADKSAENPLCEKVTQLALAKFKYDYDIEHNNGAPSIKTIETVDRFSNAIDTLQRIFNFNLTKKLTEYAPYLNELIILLRLINQLNSKGDSCTVLDNIRQFEKADGSSSKYIGFLISAVELFFVLKEGKYNLVFRPIINIYRNWAEQFGTKSEKKLASRLFDLVEDLDLQSNDEFTFVQQMYRFSKNFQTEEAQHALEIIGCQETIDKTIGIIKTYVTENKTEEARREFRCLIYNLLVLTNSYIPDTELEHAVSKVTIDITIIDKHNISEQQNYAQYQPIIKAFNQIIKIKPNPKLENTVRILNNFLQDFAKQQKTTSFFVFLKLFSRLLIDYGQDSENNTFSYVGLFSLIISQLYFVPKAIQSNDTILNKTHKILHEIDGILQDLAQILKSPTVYRLAAGTIIVNTIIKNTKEVIEVSEFNFDNYLNIFHTNTRSANIKFSTRILLNNPDDKILKTIKKCLDIAEVVFIVGEGVKLVYDIFNGNAFTRLQDALNKYLPPEVSKMVTQGVQSALQCVPIVGNLITNASIKAEIEKVGKIIENRIEQAEQRLSMQIIKAEQRIIKAEQNLSTQIAMTGQHLSMQMHSGFMMISQRLDIINGRLQTIKGLLNELRKEQLELNLLGKFGTLTKKYDKITSSSDGKITEKKKIITDYEKFSSYLLSGTTEDAILRSVYNRKFDDWLQTLSKDLTQLNPNKENLMPKFDSWSWLISAMTEFLYKIDSCPLFQLSYFNFDKLKKVFENANNILQFLKSLNNKDVAQCFFNSAIDGNLKNLRKLTLYCSLIGVSLSGYGEKITFWTEKSNIGLTWRQAVKDNVLKFLPDLRTRSVINDAINTVCPIVYTLGNVILKLIEEYISYIKKPENSKEHSPRKKIKQAEETKEKIISTLFELVSSDAGTVDKLSNTKDQSETANGGYTTSSLTTILGVFAHRNSADDDQSQINDTKTMNP